MPIIEGSAGRKWDGILSLSPNKGGTLAGSPLRRRAQCASICAGVLCSLIARRVAPAVYPSGFLVMSCRGRTTLKKPTPLEMKALLSGSREDLKVFLRQKGLDRTT